MSRIRVFICTGRLLITALRHLLIYDDVTTTIIQTFVHIYVCAYVVTCHFWPGFLILNLRGSYLDTLSGGNASHHMRFVGAISQTKMCKLSS